MIESTNKIALSIFSNKGAYALILGSGISRNAGIPTAWEIISDLIQKLAILENEKIENSPIDWYIKKYKTNPDYSDILEKIASSPSERMNLLKPYFEPTEEDRENNLKEPTKAHKAIAKMVKKGFVKVIVTTNFDRLIEQALKIEGIEPTIIRHPSDIDGTIPLVHNDFILIKLNGDYLDTRILNTSKELSVYDENLENYIRRIFEDFGIISCGWSAKWDTALTNSIKKSKRSPFNSFLTFLNKCPDELIEIASNRKGETAKIIDADNFFYEIDEKITALLDINNKPISSDVAVARLKKYIANENSLILFHDLLINEFKRIEIELNQLIDYSIYPSKENLRPILDQILKIIEPLTKLIANAVYWSKPIHYNTIIEILTRISKLPEISGQNYPENKNFFYFQSTIILYTIGIITIKTEKYDLLKDCFNIKLRDKFDGPERKHLIKIVNSSLMDKQVLNDILGQNYKTPLSTFLNEQLWSILEDLIPDKEEYQDLIDVFEYVMSLNYIDLIGEEFGQTWAPYGQYVWRRASFRSRYSHLLQDFIDTIDIQKENSKILKTGMFNRKLENLNSAQTKLNDFLSKIHL